MFIAEVEFANLAALAIRAGELESAKLLHGSCHKDDCCIPVTIRVARSNAPIPRRAGGDALQLSGGCDPLGV